MPYSVWRRICSTGPAQRVCINVMKLPLCLSFVTAALAAVAAPFPEKTPDTPGNRMLDEYFEQQVQQIEKAGGVTNIDSAEVWKAKAPEYRQQLADMLGLHPMPERTPLHPTKTGEQIGDGYLIENLHFQALPGLYVTANFYRPSKVEGRL